MSKNTPYVNWNISTEMAAGGAYGIGVNIARFSLAGTSGNRTERFPLTFYGASMGIGFGGAASAQPFPERASRIFFHENARTASNFEHPGVVLYIGDAFGVGGSAQAVVFAPWATAHGQIAVITRLVAEYAVSGEVNLPPAIPALAFIAGATVGYEISASTIFGDFRLL